MSDSDAFDALTFLDAKKARFFRHGDALRLTVEGECSYPKVKVVCAFPVSDPTHHVSICTEKDEEIGLIADLRRLDSETRGLLEEHLARRYVVAVIRRVVASKERFGTVDWTVETDRGQRRFTTRNLRDGAITPSPGRYLLADVDGNRYDVPELSRLDAASQTMLLQHL